MVLILITQESIVKPLTYDVYASVNLFDCWGDVRLVPSGTYKVQEMLQQGGWGCAQGGYTGTFTPMWLMVARKPKTA